MRRSDSFHEFKGTLVRESERAVKISVSKKDTVWIPKCFVTRMSDTDKTVIVHIPFDLALQKNLQPTHLNEVMHDGTTWASWDEIGVDPDEDCDWGEIL